MSKEIKLYLKVDSKDGITSIKKINREIKNLETSTVVGATAMKGGLLAAAGGVALVGASTVKTASSMNKLMESTKKALDPAEGRLLKQLEQVEKVQKKIIVSKEKSNKESKKQIGIIKRLKQSLFAMRSYWLAITAAIAVATVTAVAFFKQGVMAVEKFRLSVASLASTIASFSDIPAEKLSTVYKNAYTYSEKLVYKMEELNTRTVATGENLMAMVETMAHGGVLLDINNKKQIRGFLAIANALALITQGQNQDIQFRQEIRGLILGEVRATNLLARLLSQRIGGSLKEQVKLWKQKGTLIEEAGALLGGFTEGATDLEKTWLAVGTTIETVYKRVMRDMFLPIYEDIIRLGKDLTAELLNQSDETKKFIKTLNKGLDTTWKSLKMVTAGIGDLLSIYNKLPEGVVGASGTGLLGAILYGGPVGLAVAGLYLLAVQVDKLGFEIHGIAEDASKDLRAVEKTGALIKGLKIDRDTGLIYYKVTGINRCINQAEKLEEALERAAETGDRLNKALADPAKYYEGGTILSKEDMKKQTDFMFKLNQQRLKLTGQTLGAEILLLKRKFKEEVELYGKTEEDIKAIRIVYNLELAALKKKHYDVEQINVKKHKDYLFGIDQTILQHTNQRLKAELNILDKKLKEELELYGKTEKDRAAIKEAFRLKKQHIIKESNDKEKKDRKAAEELYLTWLEKRRDLEKQIADQMIIVNGNVIDQYNLGLQRSKEELRSWGEIWVEIGQQSADVIADTMTENLWSVIEGTKSAKEAFIDYGQTVTKWLFDIIVKETLKKILLGESGQASIIAGNKAITALVTELGGVNSLISAYTLLNVVKAGGSIGGGVSEKFGAMGIAVNAAQGGAFEAGKMLKYAKGGIVNSPTVFPLANGVGLMGEAGAEAILPLTRMGGGDLGVKSEGNNGGQTINIMINAVDSQSFSEAIERNPGAVVEVVSNALEENTGLRQSIRNTI